MAQSTVPGLIPNLIAFESVFGLSLVIFFDHPRDELVFGRLQKVWQKIIAKIFAIQKSEGRAKKLLGGLIRERVFSFLIAVIFRLFRELPEYNTVNYPDLEAFFQQGMAEKQFYKNLISYLDIQGNYSREHMENDLLAVLKIRNFNLLTLGVVLMGLSVHTTQAPLANLPFLKRFFDEVQKNPIPTPYIDLVPYVLDDALQNNVMIDEVFNFFVHTIDVCQEYDAKYPRIPGVNRVFPNPEAIFLGPYIFLQYQKMSTIRTEWLERRINAALSRSHIPFFNSLLNTELLVVGIEMRQPHAALEVVALFLVQPESRGYRLKAK